jgi:Uma2 family endonuclease
MLTELEQKYYTTDPIFGEEKPYQIIGGEIIMAPSATPFHQEILRSLIERLGAFVRSKRLGKLFVSPLDIRFNDSEVYQPDLAFFLQTKIQNIRKDRIDALPDLVVEVLSPSNAYYDLSHKKEVYATYGVAECWIIDPIEESIEILVNENGLYRTEALLRKPALLESGMFPEFSMKVEDVFEF